MLGLTTQYFPIVVLKRSKLISVQVVTPRPVSFLLPFLQEKKNLSRTVAADLFLNDSPSALYINLLVWLGYSTRTNCLK